MYLLTIFPSRYLSHTARPPPWCHQPVLFFTLWQRKSRRSESTGPTTCIGGSPAMHLAVANDVSSRFALKITSPTSRLLLQVHAYMDCFSSVSQLESFFSLFSLSSTSGSAAAKECPQQSSEGETLRRHAQVQPFTRRATSQ